MKTTLETITIPTILDISKNNLGKVGPLIANAGYQEVVVFYGTHISQLLGDTVAASFKEANINLLYQYEQDNNDFDCLMNFAFSIPNETAMVIGIGGGKVLDIAKYVSFLNDLPFLSVPTSTSNDGFASSVCSLQISGRRRTVPAKMPFGIIIDIDVIKNAPADFIYSGIGDLVSKITAVYDWEFEAKHGKTRINDFAVMIAKKSVNSIVRMDIHKNIRDEFFIKELVDSLTMSGIAMEIANNSAPASGSEHLISHALDQLLERPQLHGIQVGIATYIMSHIQNHRHPRVKKFLAETGFFNHVQGLQMKAADFEKAIELAPMIKPHRYTYIHLEENRKLAKQLLYEDEMLREILV